jgi:hypothetical protein
LQIGQAVAGKEWAEAKELIEFWEKYDHEDDKAMKPVICGENRTEDR